jgi:hypothetical protein
MGTSRVEPIGSGKRAYILRGGDYLPLFVGEGLGNLDYKDAFTMSALKRAPLGLPPVDVSLIVPPEIARHNPSERSRGEWTDYRGTSNKTSRTFRASKNNPYVCNHCVYRTTRYSNMIAHLEKVHGDYATDPRNR